MQIYTGMYIISANIYRQVLSMDNRPIRLKLLRGLLGDEVFSALSRCGEDGENSLADLLFLFYNRKKFPEAGLDVCKYTEKLILCDDNALSRALAAGRDCDDIIRRAFFSDIREINGMLSAVKGEWVVFSGGLFGGGSEDGIYSFLKKYHAENGYGIFTQSYAFARSGGTLLPLSCGGANAPSLEGLKDYAAEKQAIDDNVCAFIKGLPCPDMLLYGERGTGKSSTVHAIARSHFKDGLRLIELPGHDGGELAAVRRSVADSPLKFLILFDDISIDSADGDLPRLRYNLEGTADIAANTLIAATSNRRHIVNEKFSDREDAVHADDIMDEQLSLSDRFGLKVFFPATGKAEYLSIVRQLADDEKLGIAEAELAARAEKWAILNGGRSPRAARRLIDRLAACKALGIRPQF